MRSVVPSSCSLHSPGRQPDRAAPLTAKATCVVRSCHGHCRFCFFFSVLLTPPDDAPGHRRRHARRGCSSCRGKLCRSCASARGFAVPWTVVVHVDTRAETHHCDVVSSKGADRPPARPVLTTGRRARREAAVPRGDPGCRPEPRGVAPSPCVLDDHRPGRQTTDEEENPRALLGSRVVIVVVLIGPGVVGALPGHGQLRGAHRAGHAAVAVHGGVRHGERHDVGAVPAVRGVLLQAEGPPLRPGKILHLRQRLLRRPGLRRPRRQRLQRRPLPLRHPVRRRLLHRRLLRQGHSRRGAGRHQGVQVRVRREEPRAFRADGGPPRAGPWADLDHGAGLREIRRLLLLLPPGVLRGHGLPGIRPVIAFVFRQQREDDADADGQRAHVLLRGPYGDPRGREAAGGHPGVRLLQLRHARGLRHRDHAASRHRLRRAVVGVRGGHGSQRVQEGGGVLHPRHLLRLHGAQPGVAADRVARVPGRRVPRPRRVRDRLRHQPVAGVPRLRVQRRRRERGDRWEHAAEDLRGALRRLQEGRRLRTRGLLKLSG